MRGSNRRGLHVTSSGARTMPQRAGVEVQLKLEIGTVSSMRL